MKKIYLLMMALFVAFSFAKAQDVVVEFPKNGAATVDGLVNYDNDPWKENAWIDIQYPLEGQEKKSSARFQGSWNDDVLSIVFEIQDDTPNNPVDADDYNRDCIELYLHMDEVADGVYYANSWQLRIQREDELNILAGTQGTLTGGQAWNLGTLPDEELFEVVSNSEPSKYIVEINLPWNGIAGESGWVADENKLFLLDIMVSDNATGGNERDLQLFLSDKEGNDGQWNNTALFDLVKLVNTTVSSKSLRESVESAYVYNDNLKLNNINGEIQLFNINGTMVMRTNVDGRASINISHLNKGVYIVKSGNFVAKVIK